MSIWEGRVERIKTIVIYKSLHSSILVNIFANLDYLHDTLESFHWLIEQLEGHW